MTFLVLRLPSLRVNERNGSAQRVLVELALGNAHFIIGPRFDQIRLCDSAT